MSKKLLKKRLVKNGYRVKMSSGNVYIAQMYCQPKNGYNRLPL
jgi:hypothetical protein